MGATLTCPLEVVKTRLQVRLPKSSLLLQNQHHFFTACFFSRVSRVLAYMLVTVM